MTIASEALDLIRNPMRHTTKANAVDADGNNVAGATDAAVAWSVYGAVNRVAVLNHRLDVDGWRDVIHALRAAGMKHSTPHAEAIAALMNADGRAAFREERAER